MDGVDDRATDYDVRGNLNETYHGCDVLSDWSASWSASWNSTN